MTAARMGIVTLSYIVDSLIAIERSVRARVGNHDCETVEQCVDRLADM